jgi:SOS-response transcriptional repressor LexA
MEDGITQQNTVRPTKKQQLLLEFLQTFIAEHGYGPSYREIMAGCNYTSVATVAVHVNNLIARGHLRKNGRSARSLEIVGDLKLAIPKLQTNEIKPAEEKWLTEKIDYMFKQAEEDTNITIESINNLKILVDALKVMGLESVSLSFNSRLNDLKKRV